MTVTLSVHQCLYQPRTVRQPANPMEVQGAADWYMLQVWTPGRQRQVHEINKQKISFGRCIFFHFFFTDSIPCTGYINKQKMSFRNLLFFYRQYTLHGIQYTISFGNADWLCRFLWCSFCTIYIFHQCKFSIGYVILIFLCSF